MIVKNIDVYLRENGVKPSYQRKRIFEYLMSTHNHPSINDIYEALIGDIPTLSKATVYNTMNLFIEHKLIEVLPIESKEARYDIYNPSAHGHFKCEVCENIYDINIEVPLSTLSKDLDGFDVQSKVYNFKGVCRNCMEKMRTKEALQEEKVK